MRHRAAFGWVLAAGAVALAVAGAILAALAGEHGDPWWQVALTIAAVLAAAGIGLLVALRRRHAIGWLLLADALLLATFGVAQPYAQYALLEAPGALPGPEWAVLWDQSAWPALFAILTTVVLVFPDGRLPSAGWRKVAIGAGVSFTLFVLLGLFDPEPFEAPYEAVQRPLPALPEPMALLWPLAFLGSLASLVAAARAVRVRFRDAHGVERLQLKWLAYTVTLVPVTLGICGAGSLAGGVEQRDVFNALFFFMLGAIPASIGVAVLRYRLYDIDRIINRTLVYGVLTLLLAAAYGATTLVLGTALGGGSGWATAGATLLVAVVFRPLRARVQDVVDRRFSRARYAGRRRIRVFLEELRAGAVPPEGIQALLRELLDDPALELRFWLPESEIYVDADGVVRDDALAERRRTPVTRAGAPLGVVIHGSSEEERPGLLRELVEAAGLAIEIARLRVALRRQLQEVEASRARIVTAGYEERRRIERDLHDGAQQRLVSIGMALRHAQHELGPGPAAVAATLDAAVEEIANAIEELRELARGVRPAQLDEGLGPALRDLAARAPLPVEVAASGARAAADIEAAAYFIASEGLTNAVKHARASKVRLEARRDDGALVLSVSDDGVGGASEGRGSGLRGLSDRVAAHGGTLRIESPAGAGTTLVVQLPCAS